MIVKVFRELTTFVQNVAGDARIPDRDKKVLLVLIALILSPIDIIPDWIPLLGILDDLIILSVVLDYLFNHLDQEILLSHYPWGMKSYLRIKRVARVIAALAPSWLKQKIWKFKPDIY